MPKEEDPDEPEDDGSLGEDYEDKRGKVMKDKYDSKVNGFEDKEEIYDID